MGTCENTHSWAHQDLLTGILEVCLAAFLHAHQWFPSMIESQPLVWRQRQVVNWHTRATTWTLFSLAAPSGGFLVVKSKTKPAGHIRGFHWKPNTCRSHWWNPLWTLFQQELQVGIGWVKDKRMRHKMTAFRYLFTTVHHPKPWATTSKGIHQHKAHCSK